MKEKLRIWLEYSLAALIILEFNTPYTYFEIVKRAVQFLSLITLVILILMSNYSINKKVNAHVITYLCGAIFPFLMLPRDTYVSYILHYVLMIPLLWMYLSLRKNTEGGTTSLFEKFSDLMAVEATVSIVMWILCSILLIIPVTLMVPNEWAEWRNFIPTYYGIYFETQNITMPIIGHIWRNTGIFNEGPMHNIVLDIAMLVECFMRKEKSPLRIIILALAIVTTLTATGQIFLICIIGYFLYRNVSKKRRIMVILLAPIILFGVYYGSKTMVETRQETGAGSVIARSEDIKNCIEIGLDNPIMGVGLITSDRLYKVAKKGNAGFSNSTFTVFARGGFYGLTLYLVTLLGIPYLYSKKFRDNRYIIMMLFFFMLFTVTICYLKYLTFLFMALGLANINLKRWKE